MEVRERIIVALDVDSLDKARPLVEELAPYVGCFKVDLGLLTAVGAPQVVAYIHSFGGQVFYCGDFNNTPSKVGRAARAVAELKVNMFNVHASAGIEAMKAAVANRGFSLVLATTVLTSLNARNLCDLGYVSSWRTRTGNPPMPYGECFDCYIPNLVVSMSQVAKDAGVDGIICSPQELELLNQQKELDKLLRIVSDARPSWVAVDDQKRTMTPPEAIKAGATALIIDYRALATNLPAEIGTPVDAAKRIAEEISLALKEMKS